MGLSYLVWGFGGGGRSSEESPGDLQLLATHRSDFQPRFSIYNPQLFESSGKSTTA